MGFTFKAYQSGRKARASGTSAGQRHAEFAAPTVKAGSKNSNGPKSGSSKSSVPANRTYLKTGKTKPKAPKVTPAKLHGVKKNPFGRSSRVNYRQLRSK